MVQTPSPRDVLWVCGFKGNEGKTWFQSYLETLYGYARVVRLDLDASNSNILYTLSKRPRQTTDIFLFNNTRAHGEVNYCTLEHIKDGCATSTKYNSTVVNFTTPNTLVVFSNNRPSMCYLSTDRWCVYSITGGELHRINRGQQISLTPKEYNSEYGCTDMNTGKHLALLSDEEDIK